jgi:GT2 family glycosyltransferase/glycosyltransferase involved in cell wall biosynthesis
MNPSDDPTSAPKPEEPRRGESDELTEEVRRLAAERDELLAALTEAHRSIEDLRRRAAATSRHSAANERGLVQAFTALADARSELQRIRGSRLWRIATGYWRLREILRLGASSPEPTPAPAAADGAVAPPAEAEVPPSAAGRWDIVCFPIIEWGFRFQRPQQLLSRFAAAGHRVFYISQKFRQVGSLWEAAERAPNVFEVTLFGPGVNVYRSSLAASAADLLFFSLDALRRDAAINTAAAIIQLPFWSPVALRARQEFSWPLVYDCMDLHTGFSTNAAGMIDHEKELIARADLVAVSSSLLEQHARAASSRVLMVRNACDYEHFASAPEVRHPRRVVGYYGAIADWFDAPLVCALARRCPDLDFVLVGSTYGADVKELSRLPNVRLIGERPYAEIPGWLGTFDVAIIPFRRTPLTEATNPVKAYEIFAAGKPLVSVELPELREFDSLVRFASDPETFEREIRAALAEDPSARERRRAFAQRNTWERRHETLAPAIEAAFPRVSVVVVTYGNREMTRACLDSVRDVGAWPNLQVIVVDNASTDGTPDDLRERAARGEITAIVNDVNRGFAAANNQGLEVADGRYLVLLNNDTVVTRGWIGALVRHLASKPSLGMVGPSTNAIGNEARVDAGYATLDEMPRWAADFVRRHDGVAFAIPMLAMFCVALPRAVFETVGSLDERFGVGMFEDDDYARRVRAAGFDIVCVRDAFVHHWMKATFSKLPEEEYRALFERNRRLFEEKWGVVWTPHAAAPPDQSSVKP